MYDIRTVQYECVKWSNVMCHAVMLCAVLFRHLTHTVVLEYIYAFMILRVHEHLCICLWRTEYVHIVQVRLRGGVPLIGDDPVLISRTRV